MSIKTRSILVDNAIELVKNGSTVHVAAAQVGVSPQSVYSKIRKLGIVCGNIRPTTKIKTLDLPIEHINSMYQNGESENAISKHFGCSRGAIRSRLTDAGIVPRTQGEAEKLKWSQMSEEVRAKQVKNAHIAVKGSTRSIAAGETLAQTRQRLKYDHLIGFGEVEFCKLLSDRGIDFVHQQAVQVYNVDFAIGNIAVELSADRGRYTMFNPKEIKRAKNLLESGYHVVAVEFDAVESLIKCSDDVISFINEAQSLEPFICEYWVIKCSRKDYTITKNNLGQFTSKPSPVEFLTKRSVIQF